MTPAHRPRAALAVLLLFLAAAAVWAVPIWRDVAGATAGVHGDPSQYVWDLAWFRHAVTAPANPLLTDYMNHPAGINLMWNTAAPLVGVLAAPLTAAVGPVVAYNLLVPLAMALSGWCAYLAARHFGAGVPAAAMAGLLFEFSPYELAQGRAHLSTIVAGFGPLLAIALDEALVRQARPGWRVGVAAGVLAAAQLLVLEEYVATGLLAAAVVAVVLVACTRDWRRERAVYAVTVGAVAAVAFAVLAAYPLGVQFFGPHRPALGTLFHEPGRFVIDLANVILPTKVELLGAPSVPFTGTLYELDGYLGLPLLIVAGRLLVTRWGDLRVRVIGITTLILLVLSFGPTLHVYGADTHVWLPWLPIGHLPLLDNALPARMSLFTDTGLVLLVALACDSLVGGASGGARWAGGVLLVLVAISWLPAPPVTFPQPVPRYFATAARELPDGSVAIVTPWPREGVSQGMVWQAVSGPRFKLVGGYFLYADAQGREYVGSAPSPLYEAIVAIENGADGGLETGRAAYLAELKADGVATVIVADSTPNRDRMRDFFVALLGREPVRQGDVLVWGEVS